MEDNFGSFAPTPGGDNPAAGIRRDTSEFGSSKMFIPGGFQTMQSKANDVNWDDDDLGNGSFTRKPGTPKPDDDVPF